MNHGGGVPEKPVEESSEESEEEEEEKEEEEVSEEVSEEPTSQCDRGKPSSLFSILDLNRDNQITLEEWKLGWNKNR